MKRPLDTTEEADRVQFETWRRMSADEKLRRMLDSAEAMRETFEAGIRRRHPEYTDSDVRMARTRHEIGDALFSRVYPHEPLLDP